MKITNNSAAPQGVHTASGVAYLNPGQTKDLTLTDGGLAQAKRLPFLGIEGVTRDLSAAPNSPPPLNGTEAKSAADVLAMFSDKDVHFMTAKAEAAKLLGDDMPEKKADIVAALEELATTP